jgi:hypothetical protein
MYRMRLRFRSFRSPCTVSVYVHGYTKDELTENALAKGREFFGAGATIRVQDGWGASETKVAPGLGQPGYHAMITIEEVTG